VLERNSGRIKDDYTIDLPRPRQRIGTQFQRWKETVLKSLDPALVEEADSVGKRDMPDVSLHRSQILRDL
jgi:hypothetical protein